MSIKISRRLIEELEKRTDAEIIIEVFPGGIDVSAHRNNGLRQVHKNYATTEMQMIGEYEKERIRKFWAQLAADIRRSLDR